MILSLDSTDGGDLIRASVSPQKLQFGAFEITSSPSFDSPKFSFSHDNEFQPETRIIAVVLWGQTCDLQERELWATEELKTELLELAELGEKARRAIDGVVWRITIVEGVESSDGVASFESSLV